MVISYHPYEKIPHCYHDPESKIHSILLHQKILQFLSTLY